MKKTPIIRVYIGKDQREISDHIVSMKLEDTMEKDSMFELKAVQDDALILLDDKAVQARAEIGVVFGFMEGPVSPMHKAHITDIDVDYSSSITLTLRCLDKGIYMKKVPEQTIWKSKTTRQIARELANKYGQELVMDFEGRTWKSLPQGNMSDMELLQYMAKREKDGECVAYLRNNELHFERRNVDTPSALTYTYRRDDRSVKFAVNWRHSTKKGSATKVDLTSSDAEGTEVEATSITPENEPAPIKTGKYQVQIDANGDVLNKGVEAVREILTQKTKDPEEAKNLAASTKKKEGLKVMEGTLTIDGDPARKPNEIYTMAGDLAKAHLGNWLAKEVTHDIRNGSYTTTIKMGKNGSKVGATASKKKNETVGPDKTEPKRRVVIIDADGNVLRRAESNQ